MPVGLTRHSGRLLRTVQGKQHATNEDHVEQLPTPPGTNNSSRSSFVTPKALLEEDINRSPESSEDEAASTRASNGSIAFRTPRQVDGAEEGTVQLPIFKQPTSTGRSSVKRGSDDGQATLSSDNDAMIFESSSQKRRKQISGFTNIHAPPTKVKQYGSKQKRTPQKSGKETTLKMPKGDKSNGVDDKPALPAFKKAVGADMFQFGQLDEEIEFRQVRNSEEDAVEDMQSRSPSISSLSSPPQSPGVEEVQMLDLPVPQPYTPTFKCPICSQLVDKSLKEEFEIQFINGLEILNYKWQQRFCRWHKRQDAIRIRVEKRYPEVDWDKLGHRMRRQHRHLRGVISGDERSFYRDQLSEKLKDGSKTAAQAMMAARGKKEISVGYYGPRGERVMTEHIVSHLSDHLRRHSAKDRLVAAAGVSGGVSGFVQAVLVPELAEQLIMEDMRVSISRARAIVVESTELGELLYPDVNDEVVDDGIAHVEA